MCDSSSSSFIFLAILNYYLLIVYDHVILLIVKLGSPRIIHRDIKAANILIDNNYEAMVLQLLSMPPSSMNLDILKLQHVMTLQVADFGLAKLTTDNNTHVSTRVMGTFG